MPTATMLTAARDRREEAGRRAEHLIEKERDLRARLSRALADRDAEAAIRLKQEIVTVETEVELTVGSFEALDADVARVKEIDRRRDAMVPLGGKLREHARGLEKAVTELLRERAALVALGGQLYRLAQDGGDPQPRVYLTAQLVNEILASRIRPADDPHFSWNDYRRTQPVPELIEPIASMAEGAGA